MCGRSGERRRTSRDLFMAIQIVFQVILYLLICLGAIILAFLLPLIATLLLLQGLLASNCTHDASGTLRVISGCLRMFGSAQNMSCRNGPRKSVSSGDDPWKLLSFRDGSRKSVSFRDGDPRMSVSFRDDPRINGSVGRTRTASANQLKFRPFAWGHNDRLIGTR